MTPWEEFVGIFQKSTEHSGIPSNEIPGYLEQQQLTDQGIKWVIRWIGSENHTDVWNERLRAVLWLAQSWGHAAFVEQFEASVSSAVRAHLRRQVRTHWNVMIDPNETSDDSSRLSQSVIGVPVTATAETIFDAMWFQQSDTLRALGGNLCQALDILALLDPTGFAEQCTQSQNVLWAMRWIERMNGALPPEDKTLVVIPGLPDASQGAVFAALWKVVTKAPNGADVLRALLSIHRQTESSLSLRMIGRVVSQVPMAELKPPRGFDAEQYEALVSAVANWFSCSTILPDDLRNYFIPQLYGRVNREPLRAALLIAAHLDAMPELRRTLQTAVVDQYPQLWSSLRAHSTENPSDYYFSEDSTVPLLKALAQAMVAIWGETAVSHLSNSPTIEHPKMLASLRRRHQYATLLQNQRMLLVHAVLTTEVLQELHHKQLRIDPGDWQGFGSFLLELARETEISHHRNDLEHTLYDVLLSNLGLLFSQQGFPRSYARWKQWLIRPEDLAALMAQLTDKAEIEALTRVLNLRLHEAHEALGARDLLTLAGRLYAHGHFKDVSDMAEYMPFRLTPPLQNHWRTLHTSSLVQEAFRETDPAKQVACLLKAKEVVFAPHPLYQINQTTGFLQLQIIGWLRDREQGSLNDVQQALERTWRVFPADEDGTLTPSHYFVYALTFARLTEANATEPIDPRLKRMISLVSKGGVPEGSLALLQSWYARYFKSNPSDAQWSTSVVQHRDELSHDLPWLPLALQQTFKEIVASDGDQ